MGKWLSWDNISKAAGTFFPPMALWNFNQEWHEYFKDQTGGELSPPGPLDFIFPPVGIYNLAQQPDYVKEATLFVMGGPALTVPYWLSNPDSSFRTSFNFSDFPKLDLPYLDRAKWWVLGVIILVVVLLVGIPALAGRVQK